MCLAIPMRIVEIQSNTGRAELNGIFKDIRLDLLDNPQVGDYCLIHAGFAIQQLDQHEAEETLNILQGVLK